MNIFSNLFGKLKGLKPVWDTWSPVAVMGNFFSIVGRRFNKKDFYYGIAFSCIDAIANAVASNDFGLYRVKGKDDLEEIPPTKNKLYDVMRVINKPNSFQTGTDLVYLISSYIDTHGEAYLYPVKANNGKILQLWVLDSSRVHVVKGKEFIQGYVYKNDNREDIPFEANELVPILRPNPYDQRQGVSTIEMAKYAIESDLNAQLWNREFFENGAIPSGVLSTEQTLTEESFKRLQKKFKEKYSGKANAYKMMLLEGGLKYQHISLNQKDMDFIEQRRFSRDEILSIFKVPKTIVAISDDVNRANALASKMTFAENTVEPRLSLIFEKLNYFLLPMFGLDPEQYKLVYENPVPEDAEAQLEEDKAGVNKWLTVNEIRQRKGYEPIEGGDKLYVEFNLIPIADGKPDSNNDTNNDKPDNNDGGDDQEPQDDPREDELDEEGKQLKILSKIFKAMNDNDKKFQDRRDFYIEEEGDKYQKELESSFDDLIKKFTSPTKKLKEYSGVQEVLDEILTDEERKEWEVELHDIIYNHNQEAVKDALRAVNDTYGIAVSFDMKNNGASAWLKSRANDTAESVRDSVLDKARLVISDELQKDEFDLESVKSRVASAINEQEEWRIDRVVRTELVTAYGEGAELGYKSSGVVEKKKWITVGDHKVSERCKALHNQVRNLDEDFYSDADGWSGSRQPSHPNCRCIVVPVFDE